MNRRGSTHRTSALASSLEAAGVWYLSTLVSLLGVSLGVQLAEHRTAPPPSAARFLQAFEHGSGYWFRRVVEEGYSYERDRPSGLGLFPVYPLLARALAVGTGLKTIPALLLVSNLSLLGAFIMLPAYLRLRSTGDAKRDGGWSLPALGLFPAGCFFHMCYSESTFLLLAILTMFALEAFRAAHAEARAAPTWLLPSAVFLTGMATATRPVGVALLAPLALTVWQMEATMAARVRCAAICLPLGCWGLFGFMAFQFTRWDDALAFVHAQMFWRWGPSPAWGEKFASLATLGPFRATYNESAATYWAKIDFNGTPWLSLAFADPIYFLLALAALVYGSRKRWLTPGEIALTTVMLLIPYVAKGEESGTLSMGRYVAVAFPLYIVAAKVAARGPRAVVAALMALSGGLLAAYTARFAAGYPIL